MLIKNLSLTVKGNSDQETASHALQCGKTTLAHFSRTLHRSTQLVNYAGLALPHTPSGVKSSQQNSLGAIPGLSSLASEH